MRISKANLPKISRFHHIPGSGTNRPHFLKIFLISLGFAYHFAFCQNNWFVRIIQRKNTQNPLRWFDFFGQFLKYDTKNMGVQKIKILEFQKVEIWKDNEFLRWFPIVSYICWSISMVNTGSEGPLRVQQIEFFGSSKIHPKNIGIDRESIICHFGITKTPNKLQKY